MLAPSGSTPFPLMGDSADAFIGSLCPQFSVATLP
jgi:hypothetical protein